MNENGNPPFVSIVIPAFKRITYLKRLLESISIQNYKDFEVVVSDDSNNAEVKSLCEHFQKQFSLFYFGNNSPYGTPENWNQGIEKARGTWIKIMHDDDWFSSPNSLNKFAELAKITNKDFIFSSYKNVLEKSNKEEIITPSFWRKILLKLEPHVLLAKNIIGPPSVSMYKRKDDDLRYDKRMKWLVDVDFYIRAAQLSENEGKKSNHSKSNLKTNSHQKYWFDHISDPLISVGIGEDQVTNECFRNLDVEIPEHFLLLEKNGISSLKNIIVYDAWWRLFRNLNVFDLDPILQTGFSKPIPILMVKIIEDLNRNQKSIKRSGLLSKFFMLLSYIKNFPLIKKNVDFNSSNH